MIQVSRKRIQIIDEDINALEFHEIYLKFIWLIKLRWFVLVITISILVFSNNFKHLVNFNTKPIGIITGILAFANIVFHIFQYYLYKIEVNKKRKITRNEHVLIFSIQVFVDYLCVSILISYYGFTHINLAILYLPHLIITSVIFERIRNSFIIMCFGLFLIYALIYFQRVQINETFASKDMSPLLFNGSISFALFNTGIFILIFYLVHKLSDILVKNKGDLLALNKQLIDTGKEKQNYTLRATHELKAPFAAIQSYVQVILAGYLGEISPKIKDIMEKINLRCESLSKMIKNIIQLSDLRTSIFEKTDFDTSKEVLLFVEESVTKFQVRANSKKINIKIDSNIPKSFETKASFGLLSILLNNLISNAIQYSPEGKDIIVKVRFTDSKKKLMISVKDQGIGILPENLSKIFNEHFRCKNAVEHSETGNGMGLAITKEIVRLHNADIKVKSEIGKGSEFIFRMPLSR